MWSPQIAFKALTQAFVLVPKQHVNRIQVEPSKHLVNWHIEERPEGIPSQVHFNKALASREQSWKIQADLP